MRITLGMTSNLMKSNLFNSGEDVLNAQNVASTGKRIHVPSDDVPGTGRVMQYRSMEADIDQYSRNCDIASSQLTASNAAMNTIVTNMQQIRTLALQASTSTLDDQSRSTILSQIDALNTQIVSAANTQNLGRYIFAGTRSNVAPIAANPVAGPQPYAYYGDSNPFNVQVTAGVSVGTTVNGDSLFNMGGMAMNGTPDLFSAIKATRDAVASGSVSSASNSVTNIDANLNNVIGIRSQVGARLQRVESTKSMLDDSKLRIQTLRSNTEDVDISSAIIDLQTKQNAYQAAIATASKSLQMSLVDYMK